jgi:hypothetical protein
MKAPITFLQGIIIAIVAPIMLLTIFIIFSNKNTFGMVENDYYQKELNYQIQIDRENRTNQLLENVVFIYNESAVVIEFPKMFDHNDIHGEILFFRTSDTSKDFKFNIELDKDRKQYINIVELMRGAWTIKVNWINQEDEYYSEKRIFLKDV